MTHCTQCGQSVPHWEAEYHLEYVSCDRRTDLGGALAKIGSTIEGGQCDTLPTVARRAFSVALSAAADRGLDEFKIEVTVARRR
jgi:hypothetical protein